MRSSVFGCGYLGAVHAACMATLGHEVVGVDVFPAQVAALSRGGGVVLRARSAGAADPGGASGRLAFTTDTSVAAEAMAHFSGAVDAVLPLLKAGDVVVGKSTVPAGAAEEITRRIHEAQPEAELIWNPEFLREGFAVKDALHPHRFVYGVADTEQCPTAAVVLDAVYSDALAGDTPRIIADLATAQLVRVAAKLVPRRQDILHQRDGGALRGDGVDVILLARQRHRPRHPDRTALPQRRCRIRQRLPAKDIRAFMARAGELGVDQALSFLSEVDSINMRRRCGWSTWRVRSAAAPSSVAVLGASFKPDSDDIHDSPALHVAAQMQLQDAKVTVTGPEVLHNARKKWPEPAYATTVKEAVEDADMVMVLTEWPEYVALDPEELAPPVRAKKLVDGRNCFHPAVWRAAGWTYRARGRPWPVRPCETRGGHRSSLSSRVGEPDQLSSRRPSLSWSRARISHRSGGVGSAPRRGGAARVACVGLESVGALRGLLEMLARARPLAVMPGSA